MFEDVKKYEDIINIPYIKSDRHSHMPLIDRAAQFSPFSALTGLDDELRETARLTDSMPEIDEDRAAALNIKIAFLREHEAQRPEIELEYFVPDPNKEGGAMRRLRGNFRRIDDLNGLIVMADGSAVPSATVYDIVLPTDF